MFLRVHLITALIAAAGASAAVTVREFGHAPSVAPAVEDRGPVAWVIAGAGADAEDAAEVESATTALALASLSAAQLDELRAGLELLASRVEARANPFGDDLEEGAPGEEMAAVRRSLAPALTAAHHLVTRTKASADGTFAIAVGASCAEAPPGARCFPLWATTAGAAGASAGASAEESELRDRASFFAWPIAAAAVVRFPDAKRAAEVLDALRERARRPESHIALALDERALAGAPDRRITAIRDAARNVLARAERSSRAARAELGTLRPLAATPPRGRRVPSLTLAAGEIMIVPKLGALSDLGAFTRELEQLVGERDGDRGVQWTRRPRLPPGTAQQPHQR